MSSSSMSFNGKSLPLWGLPLLPPHPNNLFRTLNM